MSQSYKGLTIPSYADAADAPKAFQDFIDTGPIPRFADASARDTAITVPVEGQIVYLTTPNEYRYYDGATWVIPWPTESSYVEIVNFSEPSELEVKTGSARWYPPYACNIQSVAAMVGTAPVGGTGIYVDVNKNGTTVFTTQGNRPLIPESGFFDLSGAVNVQALATTDYLTVDIDQIGSTTPGSDLVVQIRFTRA